MNTQFLEEVENLTKELLALLKVEAPVVVEIGVEGVVEINIGQESEAGEGELGLLIGYRGTTLRSLQTILSLIVNRQRERWVKLLVDIGGYRKHHIEALQALARRSAEKARFLKEEVMLPPMNSFDRRIIHLTIAEMPDMISESAGEEPRRRVIIRPRQ